MTDFVDRILEEAGLVNNPTENNLEDLIKIPSLIRDRVRKCEGLSKDFKSALSELAEFAPEVIHDEMKGSASEFSTQNIIDARVEHLKLNCLRSK